MNLTTCLLASLLIAWTGSAFAGCPNKPPKQKWNTHSGDQRVNAAYLEKLLTGKKVKFKGEGTEIYKNKGTYTYKTSSNNYDAPSYRFYNDGTRCINYPTPRFDLYVVNEKRLILVNAKGGRLEGKVTK